ncbi:solute carrier family 22 member 13-like [Ornithodoros turicata]|uniref:solute carrier family 22 member 13-like n=1 Tax=Ornithodoros turicata TaxID=34597 RepID=UPI003139BEBE
MDVTCVIGHFGRYQAVLLLLVFVVTFPVTFIFFTTPFFDVQVDRWCMQHRFQNSAWSFGVLEDDASNVSNVEVFKCFSGMLKLQESNESVDTAPEAEIPSCGGYENWEPLVSQPAAICEDLWVQSALQVALLLAVSSGYLVFGVCSDMFGRKRCLLVALLLCSVSSLTAAVAPASWLFHTTRFLACMAAAGLSLGTIVLCSETVGRKQRCLLMFALGAGFAIANISFQTLTRYTSNWWYLQLSSGIIVLAALPLVWFAKESPRWLVATGRLSRAEETLLHILKVNRGPQLYMEIIMLELVDKVSVDFSKPRQQRRDRLVFRSRHLHLFILFISAAAVLVLRQSNPVAASRLQKRVTAQLWGIDVSLLIQVPVSMLFYWMAVRFKRRYTLSSLFTFLSLVYICSLCLPQGSNPISTALPLLVKVLTSYHTVFLWIAAIELFPTTSRGLGVGSCWACAHLVLVCAPAIGMTSVSEPDPTLACVLLTATALVCAALALLLPVTYSRVLPDTYQELHQSQKNASLLPDDEAKKSVTGKLLYAS